MRQTETTDLLEWAVAGRPMPGELASGDRELVMVSPNRALVAVIDALGHGQPAAQAAEAAVAALRRHADDSVIALLRHCHADLIGRRGVVMSLASLRAQDNTLTWVSVGNVEGVLIQLDAQGRRQRANLVTRGGIVGSELPHLRAEVVAVNRGDVLIFATDGIEGAFWEAVNVDRPLQEVADHILQRNGKTTDDALVFVARCLVGS